MLEITHSLDKLKHLIRLKTLSERAGPAKSRSSYRPVKLPTLSLKYVPRKADPKNTKLLSSKTHLLGSQGKTPLHKKALDTSDFCNGEQRLQRILISLRERDLAKFLPGRCSRWTFKELSLAKKRLKNIKKSPSMMNAHTFSNLLVEEKNTLNEGNCQERDRWKEINRQKQQREGIDPRVVKQLSK